MKPGTSLPGSSGEPREPGRDGAHAPVASLDAAGARSGRELLERLRRISAHSPGRDRYRVLGEIGRGGMGRVLRVWDEDLERELALKEIQVASLPAETLEDAAHRERLLERFLFEARITGRLHHPGIVPVHEIGLDQRGALYFTMPLVPGRNLQQVFNLARLEKKGWNVHRALGVLVQVAQTVAYAHSRGVIHRDLTPTNVIVGPFGEVYVMDWGLALLKGRPERDAIVGTPAYMAPEQAAGSSAEVDERSDVYSLGAMLYELLCGRMPHATTLEQTRPPVAFGDIALESPRSVLELEGDLPPELVAICAKAMAPRPAQRYGSAGDFALDLQAWLERRVVSAHATGRWARLKKWRERNAHLWTALEALLLVATISAVVVLAIQRSKLSAVRAERAEVARKDYARSLKTAELSLEQGGWGEATGLLESCPPELRDWAWRHLALRADSSLHKLAQHTDTVLAVAFRPDGERLVTGSGDRTIGLWEPHGGELVARLAGHEGEVNALAFSPDGALFASGSADRSIRLWDGTSGAFARRLGEHDAPVSCLAFAPDGRALLAGSQDGNLRLWRLEGGSAWQVAPRARTGTDTVTSIVWTDEPSALVGFASGRLALLDTASGATLAETFLGSSIQGLARHPRAAVVAAATLDEGVVLHDASTLERIRALEHVGSNVRSLTYADGGARLILGLTDGSIRIWSQPGDEVAVLHGHGEAVLALAADPHSGVFASCSSDRTARLWSAERVATRTLGEERNEILLRAPLLHLAPDLVAAARGDGSAFVRSFEADGAPVDLEGLVPGSELCVRPDGALVAFAVRDGSIRIHRTSDGRWLKTLSGPEREQTELRFDATGERLLARGVDSYLRVWDVEEACILLELPVPGNVETSGLAFSPDGRRLLVAWSDGTIRIHAAKSGEWLATLEGEGEPADALAFSSDGKILFGGSRKGTILVWDLERPEPIAKLAGHKRSINAIAVAPGERLFSASQDGTVRMWDSRRGELLMTLRCGAPVSDVAFDPVRDRLVAVDSKLRVHVWSTSAAH